jgi:hypothetical protein
LTVLLYGALAFLCVIALLAIPVEIAFSVQRREMFNKTISIGWLFGVVRATLPMNGTKPSSDRRKKKKKNGGKDRGRRAIAIARNTSFRQRLLKLFKDILGATRVSGLTLRARLGLDDPADTGMLWGFVGPLASLLASIRSAAIRIEPEFMCETFELDSEGKVRIIPIQYIFIMVGFILSPVTIRMMWELR